MREHEREQALTPQDSFTMRLGNHQVSAMEDFGHNLQQKKKEKKPKKNLPASMISSQKPRKIEEIGKGAGAGGDASSGNLLHWRDLEVAKVSDSGCICSSSSRPCTNGSILQQFHIENQRHIAHASGKLSSSVASSHNEKQLRGMGALLACKFFRQKTRVLNPAWEAEWANFRERHEQEMKEMKQMYAGLKEMCQELKRLGLQRADDNAVMSRSSRCVPLSESCDLRHNQRRNGAFSLTGQNKWSGAAASSTSTMSHASGQPYHTRRTKSVPNTRVNWDVGLTKENGMHVKTPSYKAIWCWPTAALFDEIVQVERVYLRNFCASLMKFAETRIVAVGLVTEERKEVMSGLVARLIPHTSFAKPWHFKYGIEAWLNKVVFQDFGKASVSEQDARSERTGQAAQAAAAAKRVSSWEEYQKLSLLSPIDAIDPDGKVYYRSFHVFCHRKFQVIHDELHGWDEWPDNLVEDFLEAMKHVWRAYKLALVFEPPASIFCAKPSTAFDGKFMEPLQALTTLQNDDALLDPSSSSSSSYQAGFSVTPGFVMQDRIIKTQVYLIAKSGSEFRN